jgi:preprotein translocase subunit YajC
MNSIIANFPLLMAGALPGAGAEAGAEGGNNIFMLITFAALFILFYFMMIRPQNKKQKEAQKMIAALKKGDKVQTIGGLRGVVHSLKDDTILLRVDEDTKLEFVRSAIASVLEQKPADEVKDTKEIEGSD